MSEADLVIRRAALEGREGLHDLAVSGGRITSISPAFQRGAVTELDAEGRLVSPSFVEPHIHLDKVDVLPLLPPNLSGTLGEAIHLLHASKRAATVDEIAQRAGGVIRRAVAAGSTFIRSHVDVDTIGGLKPLDGVLKARAEHQDLCEIQIVAFPQEGIIRDPGTDELMAQAMKRGADVVGGMPHWEADKDSARRHVAFCLALAMEHDADVDMHIDETDDPSSKTLELLVEETDRCGWNGRVSAGHCCAMAAWDDQYASEIIARGVAAGVNFIANPGTNLLLQGRLDAQPKRRGIARVKELLEAGATVGAGQDCVNDAFYPFGAADQLQVALLLAHAAQLSMPAEIEAALAAVRSSAARIMRLPNYGIDVGSQADVVVLEAYSIEDALRQQSPRRWVIRSGRIVAETTTTSLLHRSEPALTSG